MRRSTTSPKLVGERVELAFMYEASERGFFPVKPLGDSLPYDVIIDATRYDRHSRATGPRRLLRIQVKSVAYGSRRGYQVLMWGNRRRYTYRDFDFLAVHVIPEKAWYIIPIRHCLASLAVRVYPHHSKSKGRFERFRGRWDLLWGGRVQRKGSSRS
jgi:hypothetical protein